MLVLYGVKEVNWMEVFTEYLASIKDFNHKIRMEEVLGWVMNTFPTLDPKIAWNQPMFTEHDTYIIGFSVSKQHMAVAPERAGIIHFEKDIEQAGYDHTKELIRIPWNKEVEFTLLEKIIEFNVVEKKDCKTFWRK